MIKLNNQIANESYLTINNVENIIASIKSGETTELFFIAAQTNDRETGYFKYNYILDVTNKDSEAMFEHWKNEIDAEYYGNNDEFVSLYIHSCDVTPEDLAYFEEDSDSEDLFGVVSDKYNTQDFTQINEAHIGI